MQDCDAVSNMPARPSADGAGAVTQTRAPPLTCWERNADTRYEVFLRSGDRVRLGMLDGGGAGPCATAVADILLHKHGTHERSA